MIVEMKCQIKRIHDSDDIIGLQEIIADAVGEDCLFVEVSEPYSEQLLFTSREIGGGRPLQRVIDEMKGMSLSQLRAVTDAAVQLSKNAPNW